MATRTSTDAATDGDTEAASAPPNTRTVTLSDGRVVQLGRALGRHLERGAIVAKDGTQPISLMMGVVAQVAKIDGRPLIYEALQDMEMADVLKLIGEVQGKNVVPTVSVSSSDSGA
jgi:hypothetical protein